MTKRPRISPRWEDPKVVAGLSPGRPNQVLLSYAAGRRAGVPRPPRALDLGCGAARNALPLGEEGWRVVGVDLSGPMLAAARAHTAPSGRVSLVHGPMAPLPFASQSFDLVIAHGIWNLATSDAALRASMAEVARVARPGAGLFVFTFARETLKADAPPVAGETLIFDQFSGEPQCFLTEAQLLAELAAVGFVRDPEGPLTVYNRPSDAGLRSAAPVIWEGTFTRRSRPT